MPEKNMEKRAVRTARRKRMQDLLAVLTFLLLLPYTCGILCVGRREMAVETIGGISEDEYILWEKENGVWKVSLDEFLTGALAACIPAGYREETLRAQAVILRSICVCRMADAGVLTQEDGALMYLDQEARRTLWGEDFAENEALFLKTVQDTDGIVLTFEGTVVEPPYFRLSAGKTRNSAEIFGEEGAVWCQSVECPHDLEAEQFLQEMTMGREAFTEKLEEAGVSLPDRGGTITLVRDSAGYVLSVRCEEAQMGGESFRKLFALPSACFSINEEDGTIVLQTKGVGHGLGFDQYGADILAADGKDYMELLNVFFSGLRLEKVAVAE